MTTHVEHKLLFFRDEVVRCIKDSTVVTHLEADAVITRDESSKLKSMYVNGQCSKANEEMIDLLLKSRSRGRWRTFLHALEKSEYGYLKSLLESTNRTGESDFRAREIIRVFSPYLEKAISAKDIITELYSKHVLNDVDREEISTAYQNKGDTCATIILLERMQCRLAPDEWYYKFLCTLVETGFQHVVDEIEPDFLNCPDQFKPVEKLQPTIQRGCSESLITPFRKSSLDDVEPCKVDCSSQNITKRIMTDGEQRKDDQEVSENTGSINREENARNLPEISCSKDFDSDCSKSLENKGKNENGQLSFVETCECKGTSANAETLGEREQPEGQEIYVRNFNYGVVNATKSAKTRSDNKESSDSNTQPLEKRLYPFQLELAEKALDGMNTIICAPTGCGKTWVALYIIDRHLKSSRNEKKKVVFMARTGALVKQQVDRISAELKYARILVNNLNEDVKSMSLFSLLVLDECHHVKGAEPYNMLMKQYLLEKSEGIKDLPQIIGLTASIGTGQAKSEKDALDHIFRVCASLDVRCLSLVERNQEDLAKHVSLPSEEIIQMNKREIDPCRGIILEALKETQEFLLERAVTVPKMVAVLYKCPKEIETHRYRLWAAEVITLAETLQHGQGRDIACCGKYIQIYHNALEMNRLLRTQDVATYIATYLGYEDDHLDTLTKNEKYLLDKMKDVQKNLFKVEVENPHVKVISKLLKNLFAEEDEDSRAMIFVHARATSRALAEYLNEDLEEIFVKARPLLGKETRGSDKGMTEEEQTYVVNSFREGTFKVLVATSVGMEGLDVPDCNLILNYNYTGDEITKIQMPGRSRKTGGKSVIIGTDKQIEKDKIAIYRIKLMKAAITEFNKLDKNSINRQILSIQGKELVEYKWSLKTRNLKQNKLSDDVDYTIHCKRCGMFICNVSNIRKLQTSHLVALKDFEEKIRKEVDTRRQNMGQLKKKFRMFCRGCPNTWGVIAEKDGMQFFVLKAESLKFVNRVDQNEVTSYKKWTEVPFKVKDINLVELADIYGDSN